MQSDPRVATKSVLSYLLKSTALIMPGKGKSVN